MITGNDNKNIKFCMLNKRKIPLFQQVEILKIMLKITVFEIVVCMLLQDMYNLYALLVQFEK